MLDYNLEFAIIIVLLLIIIWLVLEKRSIKNDFLTGLWMGEEKFCQRASIKNMFLYVGEKNGSERLCYLVIYDEEDILANQKIKLNFGINTVCIKDAEPHFPKQLNYKFDIGAGTLTLYDKKSNKLYAALYKDNSVTAYVNDLL